MLATSGYLAKLFAAFGALDICIDLVVTAEISVACTVEPDAPVDRLIESLAGLARVEIARDRAIVAAVGEGLRNAPGTVERACRALLPATPELICFGGNDRNLSFVVQRDQAAAAMRRLHSEFFPVAMPAKVAAQRSARPAARRTFEASP
jgi:aspartokinase